jgi:hypothetical protein
MTNRKSGSQEVMPPTDWKCSSDLQVPVLEDEHEHAVRGGDREQVEHDGLERDHDRAERDEQEQEGEREDEGEDVGSV